MLNKFAQPYFCYVKRSRYSLIPLILFSLFLSACSVTQDDAHPGNKQLSAEINKLYVSAIKQMKSGKTKKAQMLLAKVISQQPHFSNAHTNMGILYIKMNMHKKAQASFQEALKIEPDNKYTLNQQAFLYRMEGDFTKAKANYEKAINIDSGYANAHLNLGILYDLYLYDLKNALVQYKKYNDLSDGKNKQVAKWIVDLERRYKKSLSQK